MVVAMPQAALETVSDALLLKHIPLPAAIKKKLPSFLRNAAPKTFIGGKIVGQFLAKTGIEGGTEGAQTVMKNVGSAINTGDWSGENLTEGVRESFIGGVAGGGVATALRIPNTFRTEKALDWALGVSTGRLDSDAQKDIAILRNPEIDKSSPEYQEADSRFSTRNNTDRQHQFDLATIASPTEDQSPSEIKAAKARVSAREDEAHWVLSKLESEDADPIRAQRYQAKTAAQKDFQDSIAQHLQKSAVDWDPSGEKLRARAQEIEDSFSKVEANAKAIGSNLDVAAAKKMALDQLLGTQDKQAQAAEDSLLDALGSSDSAGPLRAKFARQELMRLYPEQNAHLTPWFKDDSTVVEMLNARENEEIDDDTNLDSWLASPEGIKSTTSDKKTDTATEEKPKGLMTVGQRRDAFRLAEDNAEASGDENQKKEFARLKEDVDFWHSVLSDTESNELMAAALATIAQNSKADMGRVAIAGYCQTGRHPMVFAAKNKIAAAVVWYGGAAKREWDVTPTQAEPLADLIATMDCPVFAAFGAEDHIISVEDVRRLRNTLEDKNKSYDIHIYAGAPHGWLNDTMPGRYRKPQADAAWAAQQAFLSKVMSGAVKSDIISWTFECEKSTSYDFSKNVRLE